MLLTPLVPTLLWALDPIILDGIFSLFSSNPTTSPDKIGLQLEIIGGYFFLSCALASFLGYWCIRTIECSGSFNHNVPKAAKEDSVPEAAKEEKNLSLWHRLKRLFFRNPPVSWMLFLHRRIKLNIRFLAKRLTHQTFYELIEGDGSVFELDGEALDASSDYLAATVMTNISYGNRFILYYGRVVDISMDDSNSIRTVSLAYAEKLLLKIKDDTAETPARDQYRDVFDVNNVSSKEKSHKITHSVLLIDGRCITNISFDRYRVNMGADHYPVLAGIIADSKAAPTSGP